MGQKSGSDLQREVGTNDGVGTSQPQAASPGGLRRLDFRRRVRLWQRQDHESAEPPGRWRAGGWRGTGAVFLALAATLVIPATAPAVEYNPPVRTLAKNTGQSSDRFVLLNASQDGLNQAFRTGPNLGGYELTSIVLHVNDTHESRFMTIDAGIFLWDESSGFTRVAKLTRGQLNDYAANEWWVPESTYLESDTEYYFLLDCTAGCANDNMVQFVSTYSSEDDPGAEEGWDIHDHCGYRTAGDPEWKSGSSLILKIEIKGRPSYHRAYRTEIVSTPANGDTYLVGENIDIALTFNTPVYVQGESSIGIQVGDVAGQAAYLSGSFTTQLIYRYEVHLDDADANGISVEEGGPDTGFVGWVPTLVASLGLWPVDPYYPGMADDPGHKVDGSVNCTVQEDGSVHCMAGRGAALSVADARTTEGADATLEFAVLMNQAASGTVTVDFATADGTAQAGKDYTAANGTLTFAAGETRKTVSVPVLDDAHDEGEETLTLTLSNASGARIADATATGTIGISIGCREPGWGASAAPRRSACSTAFRRAWRRGASPGCRRRWRAMLSAVRVGKGRLPQVVTERSSQVGPVPTGRRGIAWGRFPNGSATRRAEPGCGRTRRSCATW